MSEECYFILRYYFIWNNYFSVRHVDTHLRRIWITLYNFTIASIRDDKPDRNAYMEKNVYLRERKKKTGECVCVWMRIKRLCRHVCTRSKRKFTSINGKLTKMSMTGGRVEGMPRYVSTIICVERQITSKSKKRERKRENEKKEAERKFVKKRHTASCVRN